MIVELNADHPEPRKIRRAVEALKAGELIAYPTDTAYALGCDLFDKKAIDELYRLKKIDRSQQLTFLCSEISEVARYTVVDQDAYRLLRRTLPGPYTFILQATRDVPKNLQHARRKTVGIRVPQHPVPQALVRELGHPILSTTANHHGDAPLVDAHDIDLAFPGLAVILDGGYGGTTLTTVVDLTQNTVIREGIGPTDDLF